MESICLEPQQLIQACSSEGLSPLRSNSQRSPSDFEATPRLSPHIQSILDRGLAENLSRILTKAKEPIQSLSADSELNCEVSAGLDTAHISTFSPTYDGTPTRNGLLPESELLVPESIADLQELVFEWEDLYFQEGDVVPDSTNPNLFVWAIRGRRPVPMSLESIRFGFGSVYIILHIKSFAPIPIMTCFYWTGHKAHFSAVACAAVHAIQLSRRVGCIKTSRQMEGVETADFFDALGKFSVIPSSSEPALQKYIPALHTSFAVSCDFHGYARVEHRFSAAISMILNKEEMQCAVVDCGKQIYLFPPSRANAPSIHHAMRLIQCMKEDRLGMVSVSIIENEIQKTFETIRRYFWSSCDTLECDNSILEVRDASDFSDVEEDDQLLVVDVTLEFMSSRVVQFQCNSCYVMKCFGFAICVIGSECSYPCRENAKSLANKLVSNAQCVNVTVLHGQYCIHHPLVLACLPAQLICLPMVVQLFPFRTKIMCRVTKNTSHLISVAVANQTNVSISVILDKMLKVSSTPVKQTSPIAPGSKFSLSASLRETPIAATVAKIWVFDGKSTRTLSTSEYGVFEVHHLYIIQVIRSSFAKGGVHLHRLYFWIGPHLQQRAQAIAKIISVSDSVSTYIRKGGNNCSDTEILVFENFILSPNMCHKPACLESSLLRQVGGIPVNFPNQQQDFASHDAFVEFAAFFNKGIFVVDKCSHPSYGLSMPSIALGCISGKSTSCAICILMKREVSSLHSLGNFCIIAPTCVLLWYGRWSDSISRRVALDFIRVHFKNRLVRTFEEDSEPQEFFSYLEQSNNHDVHLENSPTSVRAPEYLRTAPWWIPRLFSFELETGSLIVKPCSSLEQHLFTSSSCMIVDAWVSVFVWVPTCASDTLVSQCSLVAEQFVASCTDRSVCNILLEHQHSESRSFRDLFLIWRHWPQISCESMKHEYTCNSGEIVDNLVDRKRKLKQVTTKEFDLKSIFWDEETIQRWQTFAQGKLSITVSSASPSASPARARPMFQGLRKVA